MEYQEKEYPCKIKIGNKLRISDGSIRKIVALDGRFITFSDGSTFGLRHPDIVSLVIEKKSKAKEQTEQKE